MKCDKLWRKVPIGPIIAYKDDKIDVKYGHQQIFNDFLHIKLFHIDPIDDDNNKKTESKQNDNNDKDNNSQNKKHESKINDNQNKKNTPKIICEYFEKRYPCEDIPKCYAFARHFRDRSDFEAEKLMFHLIEAFPDKTSQKTVQMKADIDVILQEECDKIHCFFLHSTFQFSDDANAKDEKKSNEIIDLMNIKQEVSVDNWNQTLRKAKAFFNPWAKSKIRTSTNYMFDDKVAGVKSYWNKGEEINMQEIVALKLYTDFDRLQFELKKQKDADHKAMRNLEKRLSEFYYWRCKLLLVLNKYGESMNAKIILNPAETPAFYGPLSTSSSYHVAKTFATAKGMVLKITTQYPRLNMCSAFDASVISDYPEEQEIRTRPITINNDSATTSKLNANAQPFVLNPKTQKKKNVRWKPSLCSIDEMNSTDQIFSKLNANASAFVPNSSINNNNVVYDNNPLNAKTFSKYINKITEISNEKPQVFTKISNCTSLGNKYINVNKFCTSLGNN